MDDDHDVHELARSAQRLQRTSKAIALVVALVAAFAIVDWPFAADVLSGAVLRRF